MAGDPPSVGEVEAIIVRAKEEFVGGAGIDLPIDDVADNKQNKQLVYSSFSDPTEQ